MTDIKVVKTVFLRAPRERVWDYLTQPELLARWFYLTEAPMKEGQPYSMLRENPQTDDPRMLWGNVVVADRPKKLAYTFVHHGIPEGYKGIVEFELSEFAGGTQLILTHAHIDVPDDALWSEVSGTDVGWDEHLFRLRHVFN